MEVLQYVLMAIAISLHFSICTADCGTRQFEPPQTFDRIVGGRIALNGEFPWLCSLRKRTWFGYQHICGCTILSERWLITAAHCIAGNTASGYKIYSGINKLNEMEPYSEVHMASVIIIKQGFNPGNFNNDIALIKVNPAVDVSNVSGYINSICLPRSNPIHYSVGTVIGWGATTEEGQRSNVINAVEVPIWDHEDCVDVYGENIIADSMMCAGFAEGGKDSCQGDSGGPLIQWENGEAQITGIVSWGVGCAKAYRPGVYTNVSHFLNWIRSTMKTYEDLR